MRILLTNNTLNIPAGTENYCRDVSLALRAAGHEPWCYSRTLGSIAQDLRDAGIPVFDSIEDLPGEPDVIHGHHRLETTLAGLFFPAVPIVSFCHGPKAWQEAPCRLPNVALWVAVDKACEARLLEEGIPADGIRLLFNFADTSRFPLRAPLPPSPRRALIFSNYASEATHIPLVREVCAARDITLDVIGYHSGNVHRQPEAVLGGYDLVFAKARSAIEAMVAGCAVVQCDFFGTGRLVRSTIFDELRPWNFGYRTMTYPKDAAHLGAEVDAYDAEDARKVSLRARQECSLAAAFPRLLQLYEEARAHPSGATERVRSRVAALFLEGELEFMKQGRETPALRNANQSMTEERRVLMEENQLLRRHVEQLQGLAAAAERERAAHELLPWWKRLIISGTPFKSAKLEQ
jgi:hypothetical protein